MGQCISILQKLLTEIVKQSLQEHVKDENNAQNQPNSTSAVPVQTSNCILSSQSSNGVSPVYAKLPSEAEKCTVRNVYDGDTLTLIDERRVRFLGIDTPEIKENQPFSHEAKAYSKDLCHKQQIWISHEPGQAKEDHYGRLLAFVWVKHRGGYLCVNEGIVAAGLAQAYVPNQKSKLHNWSKFLSLQDDARTAGRGQWANFEDFTVYKTANGSAYHKRSCEHLSSIRNLTELKASEASKLGLHPCRTCHG